MTSQHPLAQNVFHVKPLYCKYRSCPQDARNVGTRKERVAHRIFLVVMECWVKSNLLHGSSI